MSALIHLGGDRFKFDQSFTSGSLSISVNGQKLGSWSRRKNASCNARIGEREYLITTTKASMGSSPFLLQIKIVENGDTIYSGAYNQYGTPVRNMAAAKELESERARWGGMFGILGSALGALIAVGIVKHPDLIMESYDGILVGGLLGALGAMLGFWIGHRVAISLQGNSKPMQLAQTSALLKSASHTDSAPVLIQRRPNQAEAEDHAGQSATPLESQTEGNDSPRLLTSIPDVSQPTPILVAGGVPQQSPNQPIEGPAGVGGWLLFFCLCIAVLGPLVTLWQMLVGWEQAEPAFDLFPTIKTVLVWSYLGTGTIMIYGIIVGVVILGGSSQGREIARTFLLMRPLLYLAVEAIALVVVLMGDLPSEVTIAGIFGAIGALIREAVFFSIWWFYFKMSKRVRNTYGFEA